MKQRFLVLVLTLGLLFTVATPVLADGPVGSGRFFFCQNLTLKENEKIDGDVVVMVGNLTMPSSSEIDGDLAVFGGNADINGKVNGNIAVTGGNLDLGDESKINGDIGVVGGQFQQADGAEVIGTVKNFGNDNGWSWNDGSKGQPSPPPPQQGQEQPGWNDRGEGPPSPTEKAVKQPKGREGRDQWQRDYKDGPASFMGGVMGFIWDVVSSILLMIALMTIGWLVAVFMPEQMKIVGDTVIEATLLSFGVGFSTVLITVVVGGFILITCCLAPISIIAWFLLGMAMLFGWLVIGQIVGERLIVASGRPLPNYVTSTILGVLVLTLITKMPIIGSIPCLGWLLGFLGGVIGFILSLTGLGAVILTRFGTRAYAANSYPTFSSFKSGFSSYRSHTRWHDPDPDDDEPLDEPKPKRKFEADEVDDDENKTPPPDDDDKKPNLEK